LKKDKDLPKTAIKIIISIGLLAFIEGLLTKLTGSILFVFILPLVFITVGFVISLIM